jgi:hypothetical protein
MNDDESFDRIEQQIRSVRPLGSPVELRSAVLAGVQQELRSAQWDRRLVRAAAFLLVVGVGMNAAFLLPKRAASPQLSAGKPKQDSLVQVAISVAEATDLQTGQRVAHRLAAMAGRRLSIGELAAMDAAIERRTSHGALVDKEG